MGSELLDAALGYVDYGWKVHPLVVGGKRPATNRGFKDATDDPEEVDAWWSEADYNIGIAVKRSGLVVLDIDDPEFDHSVFPETLTSRTGGEHGGHHLYYAAPRASETDPPGKLMWRGQHVGEIKADGYVVGPPSEVVSRYEWTNKTAPTPFPIGLFQKKDRSAVSETAVMPGRKDLTPFGRGVLAKAVGRIRISEHGEHNVTIHRESVWVFGFVKAGELDYDLAYDHMLSAAIEAGHDEQRAAGTLESAYRGAAPVSIEDVNQRDAANLVAKPTTGGRPLLDELDLDLIQPPAELIPNVLPEGLTVLFGQHSSGKSTVAVDLALTLTLDGHDVLYCVGEDTIGLAARVRTWRRVHGLLERKGRLLVGEGDNFPHLNDPNSLGRWIDNIESTDAKLTVLDTHGLFISEEDTHNTKAAVEVFKRVVNSGRSLLLVHHQAENRDSIAYKSRGSGHLDNSCDCVIKATRPPIEKPADDHWLTYLKFKNGAPPRPFPFKVVAEGESVVAWPSTPMRQGRI